MARDGWSNPESLFFLGYQAGEDEKYPNPGGLFFWPGGKRCNFGWSLKKERCHVWHVSTTVMARARQHRMRRGILLSWIHFGGLCLVALFSFWNYSSTAMIEKWLLSIVRQWATSAGHSFVKKTKREKKKKHEYLHHDPSILVKNNNDRSKAANYST